MSKQAEKPSKEALKQANIEEAEKKRANKLARHKMAAATGQKRMASTEELRGSEQERSARATRISHDLIMRRCKLEDEIKLIERELTIAEDLSIGNLCL